MGKINDSALDAQEMAWALHEAPIGSHWRHVKSGHDIEVIGNRCRLQVSDSTYDTRPAIRYLCEGEEWVRPVGEFMDGRLVRSEGEKS